MILRQDYRSGTSVEFYTGISVLAFTLLIFKSFLNGVSDLMVLYRIFDNSS